MDYIREYKSFVTSHYVASGVRITAGVVLPAIVFGYFGLLQTGIVVSLGAMCVSATDNPGPIHHRRNGMLVCTGLIFVVALLTSLASAYPVMLGLLIGICCFIFSMIAVYGSRAVSIGVAGLLVLVLLMKHEYQGWDIFYNALWILAGGCWYTLLSLLLYSIRPYKLAQQALGDAISSTADYLRIRARFYQENADSKIIYNDLLEQQIIVHQKQDLVRELLFKTRNIVKESTVTSRTLLVLFIDTVDIFERTMASYYDYDKLQQYFRNDIILDRYHDILAEMANELDTIGIMVQSGEKAPPATRLQEMVKTTTAYFEQFRDYRRNADNMEGFMMLGHIMQAIEDLTERILMLQRYTAYDKNVTKNIQTGVEYDKFVTHQDIDSKLLRDNLSMQSNIFRHAVRVSIATLAGYIVTLFFPFGHGYWILLTIIVILKPTYSLSKERNFQRLLGTLGGAAIGLLLLYFITDRTSLFVVLIFLMAGTYSFLRANYLVSVILMTPYVLLLFHLLYGGSTGAVLSDRIIDTVIGSAIAFVANFLLVPVWERSQIKTYLLQAIEDNRRYFNDVAAAFSGQQLTITQYKISRKQAFVSLANLADAFSRMLLEPKRKQQHSREVHQLVVLNHNLTSHIATLSYYMQSGKKTMDDATAFEELVQYSLEQLSQASAILAGNYRDEVMQVQVPQSAITKKLDELLDLRRKELQQGSSEKITRQSLALLKPLHDQFTFIAGLAGDIKTTSFRMMDIGGNN